MTGAVLGCAAAAACCVALVCPRPGPAARLAAIADPGRAAPAHAARPRPDRVPSAGAVRIGCLIVGLLLAGAGLGLVGLVAGVAGAAVVPGVVARAEPPSTARARRELASALPLAAGLLSAALAAGADPETALARVGLVVGGALGDRLVVISRELSLGAESGTAWAPALAGGGEALGAAAEAFVAAGLDGSTLSGRLEQLASDARERSAAQALAAAQRAGVRAVAPLGLCFLPAFVALGIVPVIAAALSRITL